MTSPADEVYAEFKTALDQTIGEFDDPILQFQVENGMADWALNDEGHVLLGGLSKNDMAKFLAHVIIIVSQEEDRYASQVEEEAQAALDEIENDEDTDDDEKILASELVEVVALSRVEGFAHCVALIHGWAKAAITADEGETVDWDSIFEEKAGEDGL
ncbi:MAG TPA: hypothetical protein VFT53_07415 [Candidatus Saccharimonadales bacterium]|nr:hypothetical protein [Candidatus Saccharimonadales bacterium]